MLTDALVILALGAAGLLLPLSPAYRSTMTHQFRGSARLDVPAEQLAALERRLTRRSQGMAVGVLVAGVITLVLSQVWDGAVDASGGLFVLAILFVSGAAGMVLADILMPGDPAEGPRTARAVAPGVADYLPPTTRLLSTLLVAIGSAAFAGTLLLGLSPWFDATTIMRSPVPVLAVTVPLLGLLTWLATRRLLDVPQPARDQRELYWQDIVRTRTLSSLHLVAPVVSMFGLVVSGSVLDDAASAVAEASGQIGPAWSLWLLIAGYLLPVVLVAGALALTAADRSEVEHVRSRLWPQGPAPDAAASSTSAAPSQPDGRA